MVFSMVLGEPALAQDSPQLLQGKAAFTDWRAGSGAARPPTNRSRKAADNLVFCRQSDNTALPVR
jgi:hypothetical protein